MVSHCHFNHMGKDTGFSISLQWNIVHNHLILSIMPFEEGVGKGEKRFIHVFVRLSIL